MVEAGSKPNRVFAYRLLKYTEFTQNAQKKTQETIESHKVFLVIK